jgi:hypothetical protein
MHHRPDAVSGSVPPPSPSDSRTLRCSEPACTAHDAVQCSYVDRRQRGCNSAWCKDHQQVAFGTIYCRRHAGIIQALGPNHAELALPDLENRAPSLANWVARELDGPIRALLETHFPGHEMNVTPVVNGGGVRDRTWGRSWKLISENGIDLSINVSVPQADDSLVRVIFDGRVLLELTPPWIEARRHNMKLDPQTDSEARRRFHELILADLEAAILDSKARPNLYLVSGRRGLTQEAATSDDGQ